MKSNGRKRVNIALLKGNKRNIEQKVTAICDEYNSHTCKDPQLLPPKDLGDDISSIDCEEHKSLSSELLLWDDEG